MIYTVSAHYSGDGSMGSYEHHTFGYYLSEEEARDAARRNVGSMHECLYEWLVIEKIAPGIFAMGEVVQWYQWSYGGVQWVECDAPAWSRGIVNFSMG